MRVSTAIGSLLAAPFGLPRQAAKEPTTESIGMLIAKPFLSIKLLILQVSQDLKLNQHQGKIWVHDFSVKSILDEL